MHRTTGADNVSNLFVDGPPGTVIEHTWLNSVQEEIAHTIESASIVLDPADNAQLLFAINKLISLHPLSPKAWAVVTTNGSGGVTFNAASGFGASLTVNTDSISLAFPVARADTNYAVIPVQRGGGSAPSASVHAESHSFATGGFKISVFDTSNARLDPSATPVTVMLAVFGA